MATWRNTSFTEKAPEAPNEKWGAGNSSQTRQFDIFDGSFQGRTQAAYDMIGYALVLPCTGLAGPPYYIHRITPMPYGGLDPAVYTPPLPGDTAPVPDVRNRFYIQGISRTEPLGAMQGVNVVATPAGTAAANYKRARLTCELTTLPYWVRDDAAVTFNGFTYPLNGFPDEGTALASGWQNTRYIIRQIKEFNRILKLPFGIMKVGGMAGLLTKQGIPFREGGANVTYTWIRVPLEGGPSSKGGINFGYIGANQGTINSVDFDQFPAHTLLFDTFNTREYQGAFGERLADVTFNMIYLPHPSKGFSAVAGKQLGWNWVLDMIGGNLDYWLATQADNITTPYKTSDFSAFFRPPPT